MGAFYDTKKFFKQQLGYTRPLSFDEWNNSKDDLKAAILYVQYFEQISLAWNKVKSFYTPEEDGVYCMMQYLMKNVPIIVNNPKRFTPNYIYRVAFNCLYCICHDIKRDRERYENETSNLIQHGGEVLDLFDTVCDNCDMASQVCNRDMWRSICNLGDDAIFVVEHILTGTAIPKRCKIDVDAVMDQVRTVLESFVH